MDVGRICVTRRLGERLYIGDHIVVEVVETRSRRVKLLVTAPRDVGVHRHSPEEREAYFATNGGEAGSA